MGNKDHILEGSRRGGYREITIANQLIQKKEAFSSEGVHGVRRITNAMLALILLGLQLTPGKTHKLKKQHGLSSQ